MHHFLVTAMLCCLAGAAKGEPPVPGKVSAEPRTSAIAATPAPPSAAELRERAAGARQQGRIELAIALLEQAISSNREDPWLRHDLARLYADPARAQTLFDPLLAASPSDPQIRFALALVLASLGREAQALSHLEQIAMAGRSAQIHRLQRRLSVTLLCRQVRLLASQGQAVQATAILANIDAATSEEPDLALDIAATHIALGDDTAARSQLEQLAGAAGLSAQQAETYDDLMLTLTLNRAERLRKDGQLAQALGVLESAQGAAKPGRIAQLLHAQARILQAQARLDEAISVYARLLEHQPADGGAASALTAIRLDAAQQASREGRLNAAIAYFQAALTGMPAGPHASAILRQLGELHDRTTRWYTVAIDSRSRDGTPGRSQYRAQTLTLESKQAWNGSGHWFYRADAVRLDSGALDLAQAANAAFGSVLLCEPACTGRHAQQEQGLGLAIGFAHASTRFDLGSTPLGFPVATITGGIEHKGTLGPLSYSAELSRRAQDSSLLSYAGARDPRTGKIWGGVTANGVRLSLSRDHGGDFGAWSELGSHLLAGKNVQDNVRSQWMGGAYSRLINQDQRRFTAGATAMVWHHTKNAGEYTFGHGGYYSPLVFRSLSVPLTYAQRSARFTLLARAAIGISSARLRGAPFFPLQQQWQNAAQAKSAAATHAGGKGRRSVSRSLTAAWEYQLEPRVFVGARLEIERAIEYAPNRFQLYLRISADRDAARPVGFPADYADRGFTY